MPPMRKPLLLSTACLALCFACATAPRTNTETPTAPATNAPNELPPVTATSAPAAAPAADVVSAVRDAVAASDRSPDDRALDDGRHPEQLFTFYGVAPGMRVAELGAGGGYTAELLARIVGPNGKVYGQNSQFLLDRFAQKPWTERLQKPIMANVVRLDRDFDEPLPPDVKDLDVVFLLLFYHDTVWMKTDRARMNRTIFEALKPGGVYAVTDHSSRPGAGTTETETLHRIEESIVKQEILDAGFILDAESDILRRPDDTLDWSTSPRVVGERRGQSDRFTLRFKKPN